MVRLSRKHIYESKQVGTIYHFCALYDFEDYIAPIDTLSPSGLFFNKRTKNRNTISFTRNKRFRLNTLRSYDFVMRFTVDGNALSNNHKIMPYSDYGVSSPVLKDDYEDGKPDYDIDEMEEIVVGPIKNFHKYIIAISVYIKKSNITEKELLRDSAFQALISYVTKYNIPRNKVEINIQGKNYELNEILVPEINNVNRIFDNMKSGKVSFIKNVDKKTLTDLFYRIIHDLENDYPYDLIGYIDRRKKDLSAQDLKRCRDAFIDAMNLIDKSETDDIVDYMDGISFGI